MAFTDRGGCRGLRGRKEGLNSSFATGKHFADKANH